MNKRTRDMTALCKMLRKSVSLTIAELEAKAKPVVMHEKNGVVTVRWESTGRTSQHDLESIRIQLTAKDSDWIAHIASGRPITDLASRLELAEMYLVSDLAWKFCNERASQMSA